MDTVYLWGGITGFLGGSFCYVMAKFAVIPIFKYRKFKLSIVSDIKNYLNGINSVEENILLQEELQKSMSSIRHHASELSDFYNDSLPVWYKTFLKNCGEFPIDASKHLVALSNTRNYEHACNRMEKIKQALRLR